MTTLGDRIDAWIDDRPLLKAVVYLVRIVRRGINRVA